MHFAPCCSHSNPVNLTPGTKCDHCGTEFKSGDEAVFTNTKIGNQHKSCFEGVGQLKRQFQLPVGSRLSDAEMVALCPRAKGCIEFCDAEFHSTDRRIAIVSCQWNYYPNPDNPIVDYSVRDGYWERAC